MTSELKLFNYGDNAVRTIEQDGEVWFVAKDVCDILGIVNARDAIKSLDDDEKMTVANSDGHSGQRGGAQSFNVINQSGLWKLAFRSKKDVAKDFTRWVTHEVLPQIMATGSYSMEQEDLAPAVYVPGEHEDGNARYVSRGIINSAKKIYEHALNCKEEKDFQVTLALDRVFKEFTGKSALEIAGFTLIRRIKAGYDKYGHYQLTSERFDWEHDIPTLKESQKWDIPYREDD